MIPTLEYITICEDSSQAIFWDTLNYMNEKMYCIGVQMCSYTNSGLYKKINKQFMKDTSVYGKRTSVYGKWISSRTVGKKDIKQRCYTVIHA